MHPKSFSRGEGGPPERSEEKAGRKRNAGGTPNVNTTKQTYSQVGYRIQPRNRSLLFKSSQVISRIPLQSPPEGGDSFPPGEAIRVLPHQLLPAQKIRYELSSIPDSFHFIRPEGTPLPAKRISHCEARFHRAAISPAVRQISLHQMPASFISSGTLASQPRAMMCRPWQ